MFVRHSKGIHIRGIKQRKILCIFFVKNSVIFISVCFNNDCAITQNTPKCVENCSDDQLSYIFFIYLLPVFL